MSPELRPLLHNVYLQSLSHPLNQRAFKKSLQDLLEFLVSTGRTNPNCWAVDMFFGLGQGWESDWAEQGLPDDFHDVLATMGSALHDAVQAPEIAENIGCLPEQLIELVKRLPDG